MAYILNRSIYMAFFAALALVMGARAARAVPSVREEGGATVVEGAAYRATFAQNTLDMTLDLKQPDGKWAPVTKSASDVTFGLMGGQNLAQSNGLRATRAVSTEGDAVVVGRQAMLDPIQGLAIELHFVCADAGVLMGTRLVGPAGTKLEGALWSPPRLNLLPGDWDRYAFYGADGRRHAGEIAKLEPCPAYAGVSAWEQMGDAVPGFDPRRPALIVQSAARGVGLGVVFVDYASAWKGTKSFLQRYAPGSLYLYAGYSDAASPGARWAWLAPFAPGDANAEAAEAEKLAQSGASLVAAFRPNAEAVPAAWTRPVPDFPASLRHAAPVSDINDAAVFTMNEGIAGSRYGLDLARKVGSDMLIRAWFKWNQAPTVKDWAWQPGEAHRMGALFGGGITCSALYDNENGLTREQVLDMATRDPAGKLVDAWGVPGVRHGSLSSPAYREYLFRWCREQIDAGADYLFMDEHTAALGANEGYDDHSLADFRSYLLNDCPQTRGWAQDDARWNTQYGVALDDKAICPDGRMASFDYRAYMRNAKALDNPGVPANRLFGLWGGFRSVRDDRVWKELTTRIHAYGLQKGRRVLISANGIAPYVDLQVLGVWDRWTTDNGHVDLRANQLPVWRSLVTRAIDVAGRKVPVVLFHDWGIGDTPFPFMAVPPDEREVWIRTRGAEIYAAGGFFAFPVQGPFGCDAGRDGSLPVIAQQTAFYQRHRDLYLHSAWLGSESLSAGALPLSMAAWWQDGTKTLALHVINRDVRAGKLHSQQNVRVTLPVGVAPREAAIISPDFEGERRAACRVVNGKLDVTLPALDAYSVVLLRYGAKPDLARLRDPVRVRPDTRWARPARSEFAVRPDGSVESASDLEGYLQGMLHTELRNPPTFLMNAGPGAQVLVHVRAVASAGARIEFRVDGKPVKTVNLPDLDGKNDSSAREYDRTLACPVPAGRHRVTVDNVGGDWAVIDWYQFAGLSSKL